MKDEKKLTNSELYEIDGVLYSLEEIRAFIKHSEELSRENYNLKEEKRALKKEYDDFYMNEYLRRIDECNKLWSELFDIKHMSMWEFAAKYCSDEDMEEAGHALARSLGVGQ